MALQLFSELYYLTHRDNLRSIAERGILSHAGVRRLGVGRVDISDPGAQRWRARREPIHQRPIHDYVPFYFNPRNPMLYKRRAQQVDLVVLAVSRAALQAAGEVVFTDGNAASHDTLFSADGRVIRSAVPVLRADSWCDWPDGKRRRCAEALYPERLPSSCILRVACNNEPLARRVRRETGMDAQVDLELFF